MVTILVFRALLRQNPGRSCAFVLHASPAERQQNPLYAKGELRCHRFMRIAVIADTHNRYPRTLPGRLEKADEIWHLGDVCDPTTLTEFQQLGPPLHVVLGNNDDYPLWPRSLQLERKGVRCHLVHIPPPCAPLDCDVILHGHTHVPRNDLVEGVRWLNPGCITRPNRGAGPSYAWLTLKEGKIARWELVSL